MRVRYVPVTEKEWLLHFQHGAGFRGSPYQRGAGLGSVFRSLFRAILPVAKKAGKAIGRRALQAGADIATDLVSGKNLKQSLEDHGKQATTDLLDRASNSLKGGKLGRRTIKGKRKPVNRKKRVTQLGTISA